MRYDLIVIGGGIAGYTAAIKAAKFNKKVLLTSRIVPNGNHNEE